MNPGYKPGERSGISFETHERNAITSARSGSAQLRNIPGLAAPRVLALGPRALVASVAFSVLLKGAGQGGKDFTRVIAGHHVATGPEVRLAPGNAGCHLAGDGDGNLRVLLAVPQMDRSRHLIEAEPPRTGVPEQRRSCWRGRATGLAWLGGWWVILSAVQRHRIRVRAASR